MKEKIKIGYIGLGRRGIHVLENQFSRMKDVEVAMISDLSDTRLEKAREIIDMLGAEKFFFATDFPMWDAEGELERFNSIPLTEREREMILGENIKRVLNL